MLIDVDDEGPEGTDRGRRRGKPIVVSAVNAKEIGQSYKEFQHRHNSSSSPIEDRSTV